MAEGFEPYHVPQQSRRDKLRVVAHNQPNDLHGILSLYDTSLLPSDLIVCTTNSNSLSAVSDKPNPVCVVKGERANMMGLVGGIVNGSSSTSSTIHEQHHPYLDLQSSLPSYPSCSIQDINCGNPFLYVPPNLQHLREFDQPFAGVAGSDVVAFKPEPLSLSLSSHNTHQSNLPLELNLQRYGSAVYDDKVTAGCTVPCIVGCGGSTSNEVSRTSVPLGPFTGYASVLKESRFLRPAQRLLEELCDVDTEMYREKITVDASLMDPPIECFDASRILEESLGCEDIGEARSKKSRLISVLDEVYRRYKQYYQQMQAVVASFECVAGLGNAAPYANLALKAMSKHFRSLKNSITDQLQFTNKEHVQPSQEATRFGNSGRNLYSQRPVQNAGFIGQKPVWRPQRGLPERAVTVLRAWLFEHFLHPYPTDTDKLLLAKQTGLSRSQVSNWFINARVRLWKPMVEEIHMLETRQGQKASQQENNSSDQVPQSTSVVSDNPSTSTQRVQEVPSKRSRNDLLGLPVGSEDALNLSYHNLAGHPHVGTGTSMANGSSGVSLTLGLHQNKGIGMSESFPLNAAQRFGLRLEASDEGYVMGGFEVQTRHFGRDAVGGQFLHDFVG